MFAGEQALRQAFVALAVAMSAVTLQGCFFLPIPYQRVLTSGLDTEDEFDMKFRAAGVVCPYHMTASSWYPVRNCRLIAVEFVKLLRKNRENGVPPKAYLISKGGACTETARRHWHCLAERVVTTTRCGPSDPFFDLFSTDCVEPGSSHVDRFLLKVEISDPTGEISADLERHSVGPAEKRGRSD
jgi:hypothetical protein